MMVLRMLLAIREKSLDQSEIQLKMIAPFHQIICVGAPTTVVQIFKTLDPVHNSHPTSTHLKIVFSVDSNSSLTSFFSDLPAQISLGYN